MDITIVPINDTIGSLENFDCGKNDINIFLKESSLISHLKNEIGTQIIKDENHIIGFISKSVLIDKFKPDEFGGEVEYKFLHLEYLAIDESYQGNGIGLEILDYIIAESKDISEKIGIRGLTLVASNDVEYFYKKRGFQLLDENDRFCDTFFLDFRNQEKLRKHYY